MKNIWLALCLLLTTGTAEAQLFRKPIIYGMYLQWGYNRDKFSKSDIHFTKPGEYDFTIHDAVAHDKPDFEAFWEAPLDVTIPQNSFRIGFYLKPDKTHAIEINFDHAKYVVQDYQRVRMTGSIGDRQYDQDTTLIPYFMHFEHTNGANFYHINYVGQHILKYSKKNFIRATAIWKAGAGIVVPKSDIILMGKRLDNRYHVSGYIVSGEAGIRYYPFKKFFLEATVKGGFANYLDVLTVEGGKAHHKFTYGEVVGLIGYDINFRKKRKAQEPIEY